METFTRHTGVLTLLPQPLSVESEIHTSPEHHLLMAVLQDAIQCFQNANDRRLFLEAEEWIMGPGEHGTISFESVCFFLGLDPTAVRSKLRRQLRKTG